MTQQNIHLSKTELEGEIFYKISNVDKMKPFFMSIVSDSNHWLFISSNGGLSAGRKNAEYALFPYYTDDKITASSENTGSKSVFRVEKNANQYIWEPFSERGAGHFSITRNLYKSKFGNQIVFEEINSDLGLSFQYRWSSSNLFGFVRRSKLINLTGQPVSIKVLDGLQNILPYGVGSELQNRTSNLADAYKRTELIPQTGVGIYALSAIIVDKAEPSEALKANVAWSLGWSNSVHLLSGQQLNNFRSGYAIEQEDDIKGDKGAYFIVNETTLEPNSQKDWMIVLNVNQNHAAIVRLSRTLETDHDLYNKVMDDIKLGTNNLIHLAAAADGLQYTADDLKDTRHFSNVLFNIMRGGIFDNNYQIEKWDFNKYLLQANPELSAKVNQVLGQLPETFSVQVLMQKSKEVNNTHFTRLATEYLPLKFSRRHGDPSRPWNQFSINTRSEKDGSKILDYQGNWRDIFQNWEALAYSYPGFIEGMIFKFLNASTFDGYNPYRVTKGGFDWETIEPDNPWSYIGYWGDHQIIYLLKFFEFLEKYRPGHIQHLLNQNGFVYANVPYKIKSYQSIVTNPKDTIEFDHHQDVLIRERMQRLGADGALLTNANGEIYEVSFCEKLLATVLSKLSNLVPDGGIWMNTQRPEWNDANNALVGNGLSMVTLYYLHRFIKFFQPVFEKNIHTEMQVSEELHFFFNNVAATLELHQEALLGKIDDTLRKKITDALGNAGSQYRTDIYEKGFSGKKKPLLGKEIEDCLCKANAFLEHAIKANKRSDDLYHTYNLISIDNSAAKVAHLSEMLEGQVAVLSSGYLNAEQSLKVLNALRNSSLYRQDQYSYILYPNKNLPGFLIKNTVPKKSADASQLLQQLITDNNSAIVEKDINGDIHFNGDFRNANDLEAALNQLDERYAPLVKKDKVLMLAIFEEVFRHKEFTGRSGTFYGYEGLGSIYWHMVSKLLLATYETYQRAVEAQCDEKIIRALATHFHEINEGIGVHKPPSVYGAFPTDPYSHTPFNKGAQQPGMTGQVKEDILSRMGELGVVWLNGTLLFQPGMLHKNEFISEAAKATFTTIDGKSLILQLDPNSLAFSVCQVPVTYTISNNNQLEIIFKDGSSKSIPSHELSKEVSQKIFNRTNEVEQIKVFFTPDNLS